MLSEPFCEGKPEGFHVDGQHCARYVECFSGQTRHLECPDGTYYNPQHTVCMVDVYGVCRSATIAAPAYVMADPPTHVQQLHPMENMISVPAYPTGRDEYILQPAAQPLPINPLVNPSNTVLPNYELVYGPPEIMHGLAYDPHGNLIMSNDIQSNMLLPLYDDEFVYHI